MIRFLSARIPACKRATTGQIGTPLFKVYQLKRP
jgi:hypothetical protein